MKKITSRTIVSLCLAGLLIIGTGFFVFRFFTVGSEWASYSANSHLYTNGALNSGTIYDKNGDILANANGDGSWTYNENISVRKSLLHAVGIPTGQIATGAITRYASALSGYNFFTGTQHITDKGRNLYLTVDSRICKVAYEALGGYKGTVGVYNYKTGAILCMVSTPTYDPADPPTIADDNPNYDGVYINRFLSASFIPGSTFKLVTLAAALENIPDIEQQTFHCDGSIKIGGKTITCSGTHGDVSLEEALNVSCNCAFGTIASQLGGTKMDEYTQKTGLTTSYQVNEISTKASSFDFSSNDLGDIAWAGIGQGKDLVNPCSLMVYMGAIANEGKTAVPQIIAKKTLFGGLKTSAYIVNETDKLISKATADRITELMKSNVKNHYGEGKFPGLDIYAKTGTAQVDTADKSNSWFAGFIKNEGTPYAFVVYAEGGGSGVKTAGSIANKVLQEAVKIAAEESAK